ncbi:MAG: phosphodiester glycosidase family protein [Actinomycetota bacterium]|nr:phosphodiester glycosidase family protein [Actinomycetota bacterium]
MPALLTPSAAPLAAPAHLRRLRVELADGACTSVHVARYRLAATDVRVVRLRGPLPLAAWCARNDAPEALVGGFYVRPHGTPLGELRTRGVERRHVPFDAPWDEMRACVHVAGGEVTIARRDLIAAQPRGDLLQAGPLLVCDGVVVRGDEEGFSAGARQFDSDITAGRYPRTALGVSADHLLAVACDGRADEEAGLSLDELAEVLVALGARHALNLDGGGSSSLVCGGELRNVSRAKHGTELPGGRAISTALLFTQR